MILTDKEIEATRLEAIIDEPCSTPPEVLKDIQLKAVAKAQLKKVVGWLGQDCTKHDHKGEYMWRRRCWECWQSLLDEVKDE